MIRSINKTQLHITIEAQSVTNQAFDQHITNTILLCYYRAFTLLFVLDTVVFWRIIFFRLYISHRWCRRPRWCLRHRQRGFSRSSLKQTPTLSPQLRSTNSKKKLVCHKPYIKKQQGSRSFAHTRHVFIRRVSTVTRTAAATVAAAPARSIMNKVVHSLLNLAFVPTDILLRWPVS